LVKRGKRIGQLSGQSVTASRRHRPPRVHADISRHPPRHDPRSVGGRTVPEHLGVRDRRRQVLEHRDLTPGTLAVAAPADAHHEAADLPRLVRGARQPNGAVDRSEAGLFRNRGESSVRVHARCSHDGRWHQRTLMPDPIKAVAKTWLSPPRTAVGACNTGEAV
jgi:hypothetical protein